MNTPEIKAVNIFQGVTREKALEMAVLIAKNYDYSILKSHTYLDITVAGKEITVTKVYFVERQDQLPAFACDLDYMFEPDVHEVYWINDRKLVDGKYVTRPIDK